MQPERERRDPSYIKGFIVEEVDRQLKPFSVMLDKLSKQNEEQHEWMLNFWANGDEKKGRSPGFFQLRMKDDDEHRKRDALEKQQIKEDLKKQTEVIDKMADYLKAQATLKEAHEQRWAFWLPVIKRIALGFCTVVFAVLCWMGPKVVHVGFILWQDYLKYHPDAAQQMKTVESQPAGGVSSNQLSGSGAPHY